MNAFSIDAFCAWLCEHETEIIGDTGRCFSSPLALWISEVCGYTCGVDGCIYGRASQNWWQWKPLPFWAVVFAHRIEQSRFCVITGLQAFNILADIELALSPARLR